MEERKTKPYYSHVLGDWEPKQFRYPVPDGGVWSDSELERILDDLLTALFQNAWESES